MNNKNILSLIPNCKISPNGVFKYIQIFVRDTSSSQSKTIVRGYTKHAFHADIYSTFNSELADLKLNSSVETECVGGGRINISQEKKTILVYGYSQGFGRCDHSLSCEIIQDCYSDYKIEWSNDGY